MNKDYIPLMNTAIVVVGGLIAYFIQRHYNFQTKKVETLHSLYHQQKVTAISDFIKEFGRLRQFLIKMSPETIVFENGNEQLLTANRTILCLVPHYSVLELYLDEKQLAKFFVPVEKSYVFSKKLDAIAYISEQNEAIDVCQDLESLQKEFIKSYKSTLAEMAEVTKQMFISLE